MGRRYPTCKQRYSIKLIKGGAHAQNEARDNVIASIKVTEKLASQGELMTQFAVGKDLRSGKVIAEEYGNQLRGQLEIGSAAPSEKIDPETGEIIESVLDFRKVQGD